MKFSLATIIACAAIANAAALPAPEAAVGDPNAVIAPSIETNFSGQFDATGTLVAKADLSTDQALQKRVAPVVAIAGIAAIKGIAILTKIAIEIGTQTIANLGKWNDAREQFTQATTLAMWNRNPNYTTYPAVICYNKGYHLQNASGIQGKVSAKLSLGMLNTDYDCMYMTGNNAFYTNNEGGYINLSYRYNGSRCTYDKNTGDLTCK